MRRNATNIGSKGRWELELKYWWTSASIWIFLLWFCVGVLGRLKSIRGGVATWQRIEPHGPPVTNFRGKTEKVFLGQLIPWDCVSEIRNQKVTFFLGGWGGYTWQYSVPTPPLVQSSLLVVSVDYMGYWEWT